LNWYNKLGFSKDPFEINPFVLDTKFLKYDAELEELVYFLKSSAGVILEGPDGSGKSSTLKEVIKILQADKKEKYILINGKELSLNQNIEIKILQKRTALQKVLGLKPKNIILVLDNADYLTNENFERIKYYYDEEIIKSFVFATANYHRLLMSESLKKRIGRRIIRLRKPSSKDAIIIVKTRMDKKLILEDRTILKVWEYSKHNIKMHLVNIASLLKNMVENDKDEILDEELDELFKDNFYREKDLSKTCQICGLKLHETKGSWHCDKCEHTCPECGVSIGKNDKICGNCGVDFK